MNGTIKRSLVLKEWDIKEDRKGKPKTFSCKFIKKDGELVYLPIAIAVGMKTNMKEKRLRAAIQVDKQGNEFGHVYPIRIDNFIEYNGMEVSL